MLHVGSLTARQFSQADSDLLAQSWPSGWRPPRRPVKRRSNGRRPQCWSAAFRPSELPEGWLQFATRYVPAQIRGVGGDWYDVFMLGMASCGSSSATSPVTACTPRSSWVVCAAPCALTLLDDHSPEASPRPGRPEGAAVRARRDRHRPAACSSRPSTRSSSPSPDIHLRSSPRPSRRRCSSPSTSGRPWVSTSIPSRTSVTVPLAPGAVVALHRRPHRTARQIP